MGDLRQNYSDEGEERHGETQEKVELPLTQRLSGLVGSKAQLQAPLRNEADAVLRRHLPNLAESGGDQSQWGESTGGHTRESRQEKDEVGRADGNGR